MEKTKQHTPLTPEAIYEILEGVKDPEIPVISVVRLGIIDDVRVDKDGAVEVDMIPTFAGCPAIELMKSQIAKAVEEAGAKEVTVNVRYKKEWSSNKIDEKGRKALRDFGLSPPPKYEGEVELDDLAYAECPNCGSKNTVLMSTFGPTACRAIHHCQDCHETFEQMKPV